MSASRRSSRLAQVESQVNYHRQRLELYVRLHGDKPSARLTELEEAAHGAQERLARYSTGEGMTGSGAAE